MAIEVMKTSVYQNGVSNSPRVSNTGGRISSDAGIAMDALSNQPMPKMQSTNDYDDNNNEAAASEQHIKTEISKANNRLKSHNTRCEFSYHEATGRVSIKVLDKNTEEVIREIPPEKTLEMVEKMWELAGFLVDERR